jgi:spermidine synthase
MSRAASSLISLTLAVVTIGFTATASQILTLRELLVVFHGNELFIGIILGNWLLLEAAGSCLARKSADRTNNPTGTFIALQCLIGASPLASVLGIRLFKWALRIPVGELLGIEYVFPVSLFALAPIGIADGAIFPYICRALSDSLNREEAPARAYLYQSLGAVLAGVACVVYLLQGVEPIPLSVFLLLLTLCCVACLLRSGGSDRRAKRAAWGLAVVAGLGLLSGGARWLERESAALQWYEYSLAGTRQSIYSHLAVIRDREQYTFFANGSPYATTPNPEVTIEEFVHFALLSHPRPARVLVIGGGAGGLLAEALKHPVTAVDYTEQDPLIVEQFRRFSTPLTEYELTHPRVRMHPVEGRLFLRTTRGRYDVILVSLPVASTLSLNRFYTMEFYALARQRLDAGGILAVRLPGSETMLSRELGQLNGRAYASLKAVFPSVRMVIGGQNIFMASDDPAVMAVGGEDLILRMRFRQITPGLVNEGYIRYKTDPGRFIGLEEKIVSSAQVEVNRDSSPKGVIDGLVFLSSAVSPFMAKVLEAAGGIPASGYMLVLAILVVGPVVVLRRRGSELFLSYAAASTGFTGMLLCVLLILAFQVYYGHVYHHIAMLTALFMLGSGAGAWWSIRCRNISLLFIEVAMVLLCLAVSLTMFLEPAAALAQPAVFGLMFLAGLLSGVEFPVVVSWADRSYERVGATAGRFYAIDLCGAVLGAILTAILLVPGIGLTGTTLVAAMIKVGSVALVYRFGPPRQERPVVLL